QFLSFSAQHKAVLFFGVFTFLFGLIGIVIGICSPCFSPNSLLYVVAIFMTSACSLLADVIFIYAAQKSDNQAIVVYNIVYPHEIGMAAYLHMLSTFLFLSALLLSVIAAYLLITCGESRGDGCCARAGDYEASKSLNVRDKRYYSSLQTWNSAGIIVRTCDRPHCTPFIVKDSFS
ncbi:hypothetical protein PENTCL1PPCAC_25784, partial [Pristionchus entomophagus]